jgi:hypothetical protein
LTALSQRAIWSQTNKSLDNGGIVWYYLPTT